jgi:glycerol-3-phosphate dehydrogenase
MSQVLPDVMFDAVVIGAGVVGCAIARRLVLEGWKVAVIDKAADPLDGASKGNSAILHTGFDAPVGSLEQRCVAAGYAEYRDIHARLNLPLDPAGALVIAWNGAQEQVLPDLMEQARANGVDDVQLLTAAETRALEPALGAGIAASFRVPGESLIDPWSAPFAYLLQAVENGAVFLRNCTVRSGAFGTEWLLDTTRGDLRARVVVNAAGLFGDHIDRMLTGSTGFKITPRKGQFVVYDKPAAALTRHILLPVPTAVTKGVVVCRTVFGNLLVGPTAEDQDDRENAELVPETLDGLRRRGAEILPALAGHQVTAIYAGLRPASQFKDYQIRAEAERGYVCVGGIRSTGLSAALGIARHVHGLAEGFVQTSACADPVWPQVANLAEDRPRDWQRAGNDGIVCHCERVTRREVAAALSGPLAADSMAGLKRRTRATMGRCQGNYCAATLAQMLEESRDGRA